MKRLLPFFITIYLITIQGLFAQPTYPVNINVQVVPPAPIYLSSYADATTTNSPIRVQMVLEDLTIAGRQVRLKAYLEGNGITLQSKDVVIGANPLILEGGGPLVLTNIDLASYFAFENITGINPNTYANPIPEGVYQFCFEVYDALTQERISQKTCANILIFQNQPPLLISPANHLSIQEHSPQNILFQWTPRHLNISNVEYQLRIVEIWDTEIDPQAAFFSSPPIFETTTKATTFLYGPSHPFLLPDKKYAWSVQAKALNGAEEVGLFTNNGYSEVFSFYHASPCEAPTFIEVTELSNNKATINWTVTNTLDNTLKYREKNADFDWYDLTTPRLYATLDGLKPETTYQYQVGANCNEYTTTFSTTYEFTTLSDDVAVFQGCDIDIAAVEITNQEPIGQLFPYDVITAGDFPVTIINLDEGKNTPPFSGTGYIIVPWLGDTKIAVEFANIMVNTDLELFDGTIKTTYDPTWGNMAFLGDFVDFSNDTKEITIDGEIISVEIDEDTGNVVIIYLNEDGEEVSIEHNGGEDYIIKDTATTNIYNVDEDGNVTEGEASDGGEATAENTAGVDSNGNVTQLTTPGVTVTFEPIPTHTTYGFDELPDNQQALASYYRSVSTISGGSYQIANKAVKNTTTDLLYAKAQISNDSITLQDIKFRTKEGVDVAASEVSGQTNTYELSVKGISNYEKQEIQAYVLPKNNNDKQTIAGAFDLYSLGGHHVNVTLIPVNGVSLNKDEIQTQLNAIYNKAAVSFSVTIGNPFSLTTSDFDTNGDNALEIGTSNWLANYTQEQYNIINQFKASQAIASEMHYVFVTNDINTSRSVAGFMPLMRRYGFVFSNAIGTATEENKGSFVKVLAHELGHGAFGLRHPSTAYGTTPKTTDFLMDEGNGTHLSHMDWKQIHDPNFKLYIFQDDQEGEQIGDNLLATRFIETLKTHLVLYQETSNLFSTDENGITLLSEVIVSENFLEDGFSVRQQKINTTDGDEFSLNIIVGKKKNHAIDYISLIEGLKENEFSSPSGSEKRYFYPYSDQISDEDITFLGGGFMIYTMPPISNGILIELSSTDDNVFRQSIFDFETDTHKKESWINILNNAVINKQYEKLQKYPREALSLTSIEARLSLYEDVVKQRLPSSNTFMNRLFAGSTDKEILLVTLLESIVKDQNEIENTALFDKFCNDDYDHVFKQIHDDDVKTKLYETVELLVSKSNQTEVYENFIDIVNSEGFSDSKSNFLACILSGVDKSSSVENRINIIEILNQNYQVLKYVFNRLETLDKEYFNHYLSKWAKEYYADEYLATKNQFDVCTTIGCIEQEYDLTKTGLQFLKTNSFGLNYIGLANRCGDVQDYCTYLLRPIYSLNTEDKYYFSHGFVRTNSDNIKNKVLYYKIGNPLSDFVNISFNESYNYAGIKEGKNLTVPLFWAYNFGERHNEVLGSKASRIGLETLAILSAPFTGGTSTAAIYGLMALSATAIIIEVNDNRILEIEGGQEFIDAFNTLYAIAGAVFVVHAVNGLPRLNLDLTKFRTHIKQVASLENLTQIKQSLKHLINSGVRIGTKIENFNPQALKSLLYEIDLQLAFKTALSNAKVTLKNASIATITRLNVEYEIASLRYLDALNARNLYFTPANGVHIINTVEGYTKLGQFENVYIKESNLIRNRNIEVYLADSGVIGIKLANSTEEVVKNIDEIKHLLKTKKDKAFFWSGKTNEIGGADRALEIAKSKNGITLEELLEQKNIKLPNFDHLDETIVKLWQDVSAEYAKQVSGEVRAIIGKELRIDNTWENIELPILKNNPNVTKITTIDPETLVETVIFTR